MKNFIFCAVSVLVGFIKLNDIPWVFLLELLFTLSLTGCFPILVKELITPNDLLWKYTDTSVTFFEDGYWNV